jgi:hypothetical protein
MEDKVPVSIKVYVPEVQGLKISHALRALFSLPEDDCSHTPQNEKRGDRPNKSHPSLESLAVSLYPAHRIETILLLLKQ